MFEGLIQRSRNPDELAAVLAHEIGHVANRDGTRSILQAAGLSFVGMLLGDFTGGGVVVIAARTIVQSAYARRRSRGRFYGVRLMAKIGGDGKALGTILQRIGGVEPGITILSDHPRPRPASRRSTPLPGRRARSGDADDWVALSRICG